MIIVELTGGLGNQMFQYAYGRSLVIRKRQSFRYFFIHHFGDVNRQYELDVFNLKGKKINGFLPGLFLIICRLFHINKPHFISGYWQSQKYFSNCKNEIREDFQFIKPLDKRNIDILDLINKSNSVSIHIRRKDYVSNKKINKIHGVCSIDYYEKAIKKINQKIIKPVYFVFSDDLEWAKQNLKIEKCTYIDWNKGKESFKDMLLMSKCKHNIIANSSFSWWGAWLNTNRDKIVIAPQKWFNDKKAQENAKDLIPRKWLKI